MDRLAAGARFEDCNSSAGFIDPRDPTLSSTSRPLGWLSEAAGEDNRST
jgi:hypothetical protein